MLRSIFLRMLLCIALVLNGSGYAFAATQMELQHLSMATETAGRSVEPAPPCHESVVVAEADLGSHHAASDDCMAAQPHKQTEGCCQPSQCSCDCLQHATSAVRHTAPAAHLPHESRIVSVQPARHVSPLLPNLFRPPIG
jgi:hypothetical protein